MPRRVNLGNALEGLGCQGRGRAEEEEDELGGGGKLVVDGMGKGGGGARREFGTPIDHFFNLYWGMYRTSQHSIWIYGERAPLFSSFLRASQSHRTDSFSIDRREGRIRKKKAISTPYSFIFPWSY